VVDWQLQYSIVATVIAPAYIIVVLFADPDSRKLGRALLRGAIPREFSKPDFNVGEEIWILFDHQGDVQWPGRERESASRKETLLAVRLRRQNYTIV
jgi:hypothetical protein